MKNLMTFVHPDKKFIPEYQAATRIQIDNSLSLGWKEKDLILATNFSYEYRGIKSLLVSQQNFTDFYPTVSRVKVIAELFERNLIESGVIYWCHDQDAFQLYKVSEAELGFGTADMAVATRGYKYLTDFGSVYFTSDAKDIFLRIRDMCDAYKTDEGSVLMALLTNNLLWITDAEYIARENFVPLDLPATQNFNERVRILNPTYNFGVDSLTLIYKMVKKPIKVAHFHIGDQGLDSAMYGLNRLHKVLLPKRLIKIFKENGVDSVFPKPMKNLMIYFSPEKSFGKSENLVKRQIDNSLKFGWKKKDIIFITNFAYEYKGVKTIRIPKEVTHEFALKTDTIFHLLCDEVIKDEEIWWYHDLDIFQNRRLDSSEIELLDYVVGFIGKAGISDTSSFFFKFGAQKLFEYTTNRARRMRSNEAAALSFLVDQNYRNINALCKTLNIKAFTYKPSLSAYADKSK